MCFKRDMEWRFMFLLSLLAFFAITVFIASGRFRAVFLQSVFASKGFANDSSLHEVGYTVTFKLYEITP